MIVARTDWLTFWLTPRAHGRRTDCWVVKSARPEAVLGQVRWYAPWRRYVFFPLATAVLFDSRCLLDIASFIDARMAERRSS